VLRILYHEVSLENMLIICVNFTHTAVCVSGLQFFSWGKVSTAA